MPIYEFVCEACGRLTEVMQRLNDPPPAACPECGGDRMARMVSRTSFQLKGGGWYSDLYSSPKEKPKPEEKAKPATAAPPAEAKPAAPPPATPATPKVPTPGAGGAKPGAGGSGGAV